MRIMINLIPEARLSKLKQRRNKRVITTIAIVLGISVGTVIGTLILLIGANVAVSESNKAKIAKLEKEINKSKVMEQEASTLQEHLSSFAMLNENRKLVSKIFSEFKNTIQLDVKVDSFAVDANYTVTISGVAKTLKSVSQFDSAIEQYNVDYKPKSFPNVSGPLFTDVKIVSTSTAEEGEYPISYSLSFKADEDIFSGSSKLKEGSKK